MKLTRSRWLLILIIMVILAIGLLTSNPPETPLQRAYRVCKDCGMYEPEIDMLIEQVRLSGLTPKESVEVMEATAGPDAVKLCRDCVETVVWAGK